MWCQVWNFLSYHLSISTQDMSDTTRAMVTGTCIKIEMSFSFSDARSHTHIYLLYVLKLDSTYIEIWDTRIRERREREIENFTITLYKYVNDVSHGIIWCPLWCVSNSYWPYGGPSGWNLSVMSLFGESCVVVLCGPCCLLAGCCCFPCCCVLALHFKANRSSDAISEHNEI